ncbi:HAD family hydrolase [Streptomyces sp. NPDC007905]|uniref:HAD family hydrolase n=1 Tax=Streptomyces sp. NPDC007905 TaxID=3364788 RepID=UPI0036E69F19
MSALAARLEHVGLPGPLLPAWFAGVLRDGVALTLAGGHASFAAVARDGLRTLAARAGLAADGEEAAEYVLGGPPELPLHPDVPDGVRALRAARYRLVTLTNGSAATTRAVLDRVGLTDCFEAHLDVEGVGRWKPAREA